MFTGVLKHEADFRSFSTDYGLMSLIGFTFMLGMGVFFWVYIHRKMAEDGAAAKATR